jgi:hypothetical protein
MVMILSPACSATVRKKAIKEKAGSMKIRRVAEVIRLRTMRPPGL